MSDKPRVWTKKEIILEMFLGESINASVIATAVPADKLVKLWNEHESVKAKLRIAIEALNGLLSTEGLKLETPQEKVYYYCESIEKARQALREISNG